eukprot:jgi/Mesen1/5431/ME000027S04805
MQIQVSVGECPPRPSSLAQACAVRSQLPARRRGESPRSRHVSSETAPLRQRGRPGWRAGGRVGGSACACASSCTSQKGLPLLGVIPEDAALIGASNQGMPLVLKKPPSMAGLAIEAAAWRLAQSEQMDVVVLPEEKKKGFSFF